MIRRLRPIVVALFVAGTLAAQTQPIGKIIGQIRIAGGDFPPHQILVELRLHGGAIGSEYADTDGRFTFSNLVNGE